jgi:hypothetical protein
MGILKTLGEFQNDVVGDVLDIPTQVTKGAAQFVCGIRAKYPNTFFDRSLGRAIMNQVCRVVDSPPPPANPLFFSGGQCTNSFYRVLVYFENYNNGVFLRDQVEEFIEVPGAIGRVVSYFSPPVGGVLMLRVNTSTVPYSQAVIERPVGSDSARIVIKRVVVTPMPGQLDNCGNFGNPYLPDPPIDPSDFRGTYQVCDFDETGTEIECYEVPIDVNPDDLIDFPICFEVDGIRICIDAEGFTKADDIQPKEPPIDELCPDEPEEGDKVEEEVPNIEWVTVEIIEFKPENKIIAHVEEEDSDHFVGYISWTTKVGSKQYTMNTLPIRKLRNAFKAPDGATGYRVYSTYGAKLKTTAHKSKKEGEECP